MWTAVISKKGGVGKTTTSVSLAAALARRGRRVLVVDLDPNAGASLSLGLAKHQLVGGVADVLLHGADPLGAILPVGERLDVMPASVDLRGAELALDRQGHKESVLARRLESLKAAGRYDDVFFDCPSSFGLLSGNAVVAADAFLVPATAHFLALEGLENLIAAAERLALRTGRRTECLGIVLTGVDYRIRTTYLRVRRIRQRFGTKVFAVEVRTNVSLAEAPEHGRTIFDWAPRSTGARAYALLAEEYLDAAAALERAAPAALDAPLIAYG
ncbi:MAG: ParA family protein [Acidobacteriota bacterium]